MLDGKRFELRMIKWLQAEDEIYCLGGHFELIAYLIKYKEQQMGISAEKAIDLLGADIGQVVKVMKEKNEEDKDELVSKISEELGYS